MHQCLYERLSTLPNELIALIVDYTGTFSDLLLFISAGSSAYLYEYRVDTENWNLLPSLNSGQRPFHPILSTPDGTLIRFKTSRDSSTVMDPHMDHSTAFCWHRGAHQWEALPFTVANHGAELPNRSHAAVFFDPLWVRWLDFDRAIPSRAVLHKIATTTPFPLFNASAVDRSRTFLYICGGLQNGMQKTNTLTRTDLRTGAWNYLREMKEARDLHAATVAADGRLYVFGGYAAVVDGRKEAPCASAECYDPVNDQWSPLPALPWVQGVDRLVCECVPGDPGGIYLFQSLSDSVAFVRFDLFRHQYEVLPDPHWFLSSWSVEAALGVASP